MKPEKGEQEYIRGRIFHAVEYERKITFRGALMRITNPNAPKGTKPLLELDDVTQNAEYHVPAGYKVEVIDGWVELTKSAGA